MNAKNKYIGITIGPIFDTINLTSSPASLWAASYLFSLISKTMCEKLIENGVSEEDIITPYYKKDDVLINKNNGVGLFHDRIIFHADNFKIEHISRIKAETISKVAEIYGVDSNYLSEYVMLASAEFEADNPIIESGKMLDSLELAKPFVFKEEINPILSLFTGKEDSKNDAIKALKIVRNSENFQLKKSENALKSLLYIVHTGDGFKKHKYYAIVRSDGDNMSEIIKSLSGDAEVRKFSHDCFLYCSKIAEAVGKYDGVTIYSGGDDLLAILPCESKETKTPFDFVHDANEIFGEIFDKYNKPTSLSFGITIAYYKFPLYEALSDSANLLFGIAKSKKNGLAIRLQKHAGQSEGLFISNEALKELIDLQKIVLKKEDEILVSAMHKLSQFKGIFNASTDKETVCNLFVNTFDASSHENNTFVHNVLPEFFWNLQNGLKINAVDAAGITSNDSALTMCDVLRILKFFIEKDGDTV